MHYYVPISSHVAVCFLYIACNNISLCNIFLKQLYYSHIKYFSLRAKKDNLIIIAHIHEILSIIINFINYFIYSHWYCLLAFNKSLYTYNESPPIKTKYFTICFSGGITRHLNLSYVSSFSALLEAVKRKLDVSLVSATSSARWVPRNLSLNLWQAVLPPACCRCKP